MPAIDTRAMACLTERRLRAMDGVTPNGGVAAPGDRGRQRIASSVLPSPLSSFVGRDRDLSAMAELFAAGRLVTITGAGGSGKTRLAIEFAARHGDRGSPFVFVDLASITDEQLIVGSIAAALGVQQPGTGDLVEALAGRGRTGGVHLVLDNLEHLPAAGPVIAALLSGWSAVTVLATSRAPLHVQGEQQYTLGPMTVPGDADRESFTRLARVDFVRLFVDRARSIDPGFTITDDNANAIAEICTRLEGLPLAIELAAARTRARTPAALLRQLEPLLPLLSGGPLDVPPRQQTVQATIAWSFDLLSRREQQLFADLGVFVGGFTVPACEAVVTTGGGRARMTGPPISMLERLVDQSLLSVRPGPDAEPRFAMLETIREFARSRLSAARVEVLRDRHLDFFLTLAEDTDRASRGPEQATRVRQLTADQANVRAALAWSRETGQEEALARLAAALDDLFWYEAGGLREGLSWLESAARLASSAAPTVRVRLLQRAGWIARELGFHDRATDLFAASRLAATEDSDEAGMAEAMFYVAHRSLDDEAPDLDLATARLDEAYVRARHAGAVRLMGQIRVDQGDVARRHGNVDIARSRYDDAIGLARQAEDAGATAYALLQLGGLDRSVGDSGPAVGSLTESIRLSGEVGDKALLHWAMFSLARTLLEAGDLVAARLQLRDGARVLDELRGNSRECMLALAVASEWLAGAGRVAPAVEGWATAARGRRDQTRAMPQYGRQSLDRGYARARKALGPVRFHRHWLIGEHRDPQDALDRALAEVESVDLASQPATSPGIVDRYALTGRELQVLGLVASGMSDGEIADELVISRKTASVHVANLKGKLGARTRVEIAVLARRGGLD